MKALKKFITVLTLSTLGFAFTSNAAPINLWDWQVDAEFSDFSPAGSVTGSLPNTNWNNDPTTLSWGNSAESSLVITGNMGNGHSTGTATLGTPDLTTQLTHNNFIITGTTLNAAMLTTRLLLEPSPVTMPFDIAPPALFFNINFLETSNDGDCEVPSTPGPSNNTDNCNDIFAISPVGPFNQMFILGDYSYNVELIVDGLGPLSDEACTAAFGGQATSGCEGFTTIEGQANTFDVNLRITSQPVIITSVPEPSSILLLSLAMFGIVASSRSKHS